ncbi:MAG: helix-turn-helix transcriptional regulator [Pseudomonadota bacterium]
MSNSIQNLGKAIKLLRCSHLTDVKSLASAIGVSVGHINAVEANRRLPSHDFIHKVTKYLGIEPAEVYKIASQLSINPDLKIDRVKSFLVNTLVNTFSNIEMFCNEDEAIYTAVKHNKIGPGSATET